MNNDVNTEETDGKSNNFDLKVIVMNLKSSFRQNFSKTVEDALKDIKMSDRVPNDASKAALAQHAHDEAIHHHEEAIDNVFTKHTTKCPECDGRVEFEYLSKESRMTVYGRTGVRHVLHVGYRCVEKHCRTGLYHGYRIMKGGWKVYEDDCLEPHYVFLGVFLNYSYNMLIFTFLVVSRKTAFNIDFLYNMTLKIYRHNATMDGLSDEFNDFFCDGIDSFILIFKYC